MTGKGVSREHFQPKTCSGKKEDFKKIVFIDVDSDQVDEVVIIDYPEFMSKSHRSGAPSRDRVCTPQSVISIDDDDDEESDDAEIPGVVAGGVGELDSDASSSKMSSPDSSGVRNSLHIDVDESGVCEKDSESDGLKNWKAGPAEGSGRNRYGLDGSESESSDSDCSDCELMDREQWEKISVKRKRTGFNDQPCYDEHASSSGLHFNKNVYIDIDEENRSGENAGGTTHFGPTNEEEMQSLRRSCEIGHGKSTRSKDFSPCTQHDSHDFCSDVTGVSRFNKEFSGEEFGFLNLSQEERKRQVTNTESTLKSKDDPLFDLNSKCASVDERHVNCDGPALNDHQCGLTSTTSNERDIINEREKLKETDEYKQAMEEEWASRQLQLQIQAEEAQILRKRRKAEKRQLDMQRRLKERIEEVRETQKKDEEFMNLKEQLRVEIRKGLNHLEMQCHDMTSLLRGLGIHVGGSFTPLPNEVQAAYKRALFTFHPDRASKTDVRAQVEAEEKFKLISRLKDKFLLTSCH